MAVGGDSRAAVRSYVALGKETTFGTYASATTAVAAVSNSFRTDIESLKLDQISLNRGYSHRVTLGKTVAGTLEQYLHPEESVLLVAAALGGVVTSTSITSGALHSIPSGNFDTSTAIRSLSFNIRKGETDTFRYLGGRVNTLKLTGNVGEPVMLSAEIVFRDSTMVSDDISASLSLSTVNPFTFVNGVFRYQASETAANTTTANEPIQSFELTINNNVVTGENSRSLGTTTVDILPVTRRDIEFKVTNRWDTTATYNRFIQATQGSGELFFSGQSISSEFNYEMTVRLPRLFNVTGDTEISGADEVLTSEITYDVILDGNAFTATSREIGVTFRNVRTSY